MWEFWLGYWWAVLIYGLAFGFVTKIVIKNKGYQEGKWFWWGFFFGVFALIVACTKPANVNASGQMSAVANSPLPQAVGLEKDYDTLYAIPERQYSIGNSVVRVILASLAQILVHLGTKGFGFLHFSLVQFNGTVLVVNLHNQFLL